MDYRRTLEVDVPYEDAVAATRAALAEQGFGILWEMDMQATLKAKVGVDIEPYVVLGACNPGFAARALAVDRSLGVLLPCNVAVSARVGGGSTIRMLEPEIFPVLTGLDVLAPISHEVSVRLQAALDRLAGA